MIWNKGKKINIQWEQNEEMRIKKSENRNSSQDPCTESTKRHGVAEWVRKQDPYTGCDKNNAPFYYKVFYYKIISM